MGLALGITLFGATGAIMVGYIVGCALVLGRIEPHMSAKKEG